MGSRLISADSRIGPSRPLWTRRSQHSRPAIVLGAFLAVLIPALRGSDAPVGASPDLSCVEDLEIPQYTFIARRSPSGGTVTATVTVGASGKEASIDTTSSDSNLAQEVRLYLEKYTSYSRGCEGRQLQIRFTFELKGRPQEHPPLSVRFRPPNHFVRVSQPMKPEVN